eukprot:scaffold34_cov260-Pinguiococcus_pyrenoidosus.AAC.26
MLRFAPRQRRSCPRPVELETPADARPRRAENDEEYDEAEPRLHGESAPSFCLKIWAERRRCAKCARAGVGQLTGRVDPRISIGCSG